MPTDLPPALQDADNVVYVRRFPNKARAAFAAIDGGPKLEMEIRLCRTLLEELCEPEEKDYRVIVLMMNALMRAVKIQDTRKDAIGELERWLDEVATMLLEEGGVEAAE